MPDIVNAGDAGIAVLQNNPTFRTVYPNKVFDYMSCARPVVLAIDGVARELVCDRATRGTFRSTRKCKAIAGVILQLAGDPAKCAEFGRNGRQWVVVNAGRDRLAARYLEIMQDLIVRETKPVEQASRAGS